MVHADAVIVELIQRYARSRGWSDSYASRVLAGSGTTLRRIAAGGSLTARRAAAIVQRVADHWPADLAWPTDIPRPTPAPGSPAADCPPPGKSTGINQNPSKNEKRSVPNTPGKPESFPIT